MKKVFSFVMAIVVLATALGVSVGAASAAGSAVVFYAPGVSEQDVKNATMLVNSDYVDANCALKDAETSKVVCQVPGKYAGEDVQVFLGGQVFFVTVSAVRTGSGGDGNEPEPLTCGAGEIMGAMVTFNLDYYGIFTWFFPGTSLDEVTFDADWQIAYWIDNGYGGGSYVLGDLICYLGT